MADLLQFRSTKPGSMLYTGALLEPRAYAPAGQKPKPDAKKSYSVNMYYDADHPDVKAQKDQMLASAKAKWPGLNIVEEIKEGRMRMPFTTGDKLIAKRATKLKAKGKEPDTVLDFLKGKVVFKASSDFPVALGVRVKDQGDIDVNDQNKAVHKSAFYDGVLGLWGVSYSPYDAVKEDDKPGVKAYLDMAHSLNSGPRHKLGGRSAADTFKGVAGAAVTTDPTAGDDTSSSEDF